MKLLRILSLLLLPVLAVAQTKVKPSTTHALASGYTDDGYPLTAHFTSKPFRISNMRTVSLKDSVLKYDQMVKAYKRMSGFRRDSAFISRVTHKHDSVAIILNKWSGLYEDSLYHAKMKN